MAAVRRQRLFPILAEGYEHGSILDGKKDGSLAVRLIDVLVIGPARNHEDVALLPFKADAPDDGRTSALKDVVHGTVYLAMSLRVKAGTQHLNPGRHSVHDRATEVRVGILGRDVVKRAGVNLSQISERPLGRRPLVCREFRIDPVDDLGDSR
jgi:hypothetical protein